MGQEILELNLVQRKDIAVRTVGLQSKVSEGLKDKSRGEDLGLESGTMDQESGLDGFRLTKPKSTWTRINRMDFGLGEISRALKLPTLGKRNSRPEVGEGSEADYDKRVVKCGKGGNMIMILMVYRWGWNCQELANPWIDCSLRKLVREQTPTMCFLMETRLDKEGFDKLYSNLQYQNKVIVKHSDSGGGLALLWKNDINMEVVNYIANHVLARITEEDGFV